MELGKIYSGFKLIEKEFIAEENSTALIFEHEKTKARLLKLSNEENNKVFGIGFKTPPENSTGVAHILEHSVLNGSQKYTTREPFMDLLKSSLQTFLNAMTFSDKTIYPVASRNTKDFHNLMDVYLDAVFNPRIYDVKEIFMQEGWHYELDSADKDIIYKGVVYNEMKGAMSGAEDQVMEEIMKHQYPDTVYSNNSGGDPYSIPELSYEEFLDFHRKLYHPSNSYIFLYGNGDTERELEHIQEFLEGYEYLDVDSYIAPQEPFKEPKTAESVYSISKDEDPEGKSYLSYSVCLGESTDFENSIMNELLNEIYVESEASPVKKELLEKGICEDVIASYSDGLYQTFSIIAKNADSEKMDEFREIVDRTFKDAAENGVDEKLLSASLNKIEFTLREKQDHSAKGVISFITAFHTWLYGESPLTALRYEEPLSELKEKLKDGYFKEYVSEKLVDSSNKVYLTVKPEPGLYEKKDAEVKEELKALKDKLSESEIDKMIEENGKLSEFQTRIDTEEDRATIPKLSLKDLDTKIERIETEEREIDGNKVLYLNEHTNGINYIKLVMNSDFVPFEDVPYLSLLASSLSSLDTENFDYSSLSNEIYINSGDIGCSVHLYSDFYTHELYPKFSISAKCLDGKIEKTAELMREIAFKTDFGNKKRMKEIVMQLKSKAEMSVFDSGHVITMARTLSKFHAGHRYNELAKGLEYYFFLQELDKNFDERFESLREKLENLYEKVFRKNGIIVNLVMNEDSYKETEEAIKPLLNELKDFPAEKADFSIEDIKEREGITSGASVQYVSKGYDIKEAGAEYDGSLAVLANIVNMDYLHNNIRAIGGAYGAGIKFYTDGSVATYSYRDPNLENTVKVYDGIGKYIENMELSKSDLEDSIIGVMSTFDPVLTVKIKAGLALNRYITNVKYEDLDKHLSEALNTDLDKLKSYSSLLEKAMNDNRMTVLGNENKIMENKDMFDKIIKLKK